MIHISVERGLVSLSEAARLLGVSRQRAHQLCQQGALAGAALMDCGDGRTAWVIPRAQVNERINRRKK